MAQFVLFLLLTEYPFSSPGTINRIHASADVLALRAEEEYDDVGGLHSRALPAKGSTIVERRIGWTVDELPVLLHQRGIYRPRCHGVDSDLTWANLLRGCFGQAYHTMLTG